MLNEHHQTATCMDPAAPIMLGILARQTKTARLLLLGNPIANRRDPVRVAEEMAMVDVISRGRVEVGFVRGVPYEISAMNSKPVGMPERLWEAHDLILKAWTTHDGPFSWESENFPPPAGEHLAAALAAAAPAGVGDGPVAGQHCAGGRPSLRGRHLPDRQGQDPGHL